MRKEFFTFMLAMLLIVSACGIAGTVETHYYRNAIVTGVYQYETVYTDTNGNMWATEDKGYKVGDKVRLYMFNSYTDHYIDDDTIVKVKKGKVK